MRRITYPAFMAGLALFSVARIQAAEGDTPSPATSAPKITAEATQPWRPQIADMEAAYRDWVFAKWRMRNIRFEVKWAGPSKQKGEWVWIIYGPEDPADVMEICTSRIEGAKAREEFSRRTRCNLIKTAYKDAVAKEFGFKR